jgi:putative nucleotidyltransferase with HDIG domain
MVEADDSYTGEHCKGVVSLALEVADALGLDARQKRNVEFGALLHDVGKIAIPNEIINKQGALDEREWAIIKTHTIEGQKMLERIGGVMRDVGRIVRASHERWDGAGYPDGLSGQAIPIEARIIAACDAFNAMTTTRSYRKAMPLSAAIAELTHCAGSQFDPDVVSGLLRVMSPAPSEGKRAPDDAPDQRAAVAAAAKAPPLAIAAARLIDTPEPALTARELTQPSPPRAS